MSRLSRAVALGPSLLAGCLLLAPGAASADPVVQEFAAGLRAGAAPQSIAAGPDGSMWFTEALKPGLLGRVGPDGAIQELTIAPSARATAGIAAGPDGNLWFTEPSTPAIGRMTPAGKVVRWGSLSDGPTDLVAGVDGNVWFTEPDDGVLGRITPTGSIAEFRGGSSSAKPHGIVTGPDGALWWSEQTSTGWIVRADPRTGAVKSYALPTAGRPTDLAPGPDGAVWFTAPTAGGSSGAPAGGIVGRITADGQVAEHATPAGLVPLEITAGPDGALWFTVSGGSVLGRMDTGGRVTTLPLPAGGTAVDVTAGPGGTVWYTGAGPDRIGKVSFVAPAGPAPAAPLAPEAPGPAIAATPAPAATAVAELGRSVVVAASKGTVKVRQPGSKRYISLTASAGEVPVGSLVDTRKGTVALRTAVDARGATQDGAFRGAVFQVRQARKGNGMTELVLGGGSFAGCRTSAPTAGAGAASAAKRRPVRSLWGSDTGGRFRTRGRDSVATVRGTRWRTTDRCDGTLTEVAAGAVTVRDRATDRTVVVRAGHSHLARHAR